MHLAQNPQVEIDGNQLWFPLSTVPLDWIDTQYPVTHMARASSLNTRTTYAETQIKIDIKVQLFPAQQNKAQQSKVWKKPFELCAQVKMIIRMVNFRRPASFDATLPMP